MPKMRGAHTPLETHHVALLFQLAGRPFPLPLVHGTVAGEPTWMLVDTGATSHVIAGWLARRAHLDVQNFGDVGTDHAGHAIVTSRAARPRLAFDGWGLLPDSPILVTEVPEAVARLGIGAFISPQELGGAGAVVLDLVHGEMRTESSDNAAAAVGNVGANLFVAPHTCSDEGSPITRLAYVASATIEGTHVALLLDTGAHHTDLLASTAAGKRFLGRSVPSHAQVYAASGKIVTRTLHAVRLKVGEYAVVTDVDLIPGEPDAACPRDGVVAMDVLRSCVVVLDHASAYGRCGL